MMQECPGKEEEGGGPEVGDGDCGGAFREMKGEPGSKRIWVLGLSCVEGKGTSQGLRGPSTLALPTFWLIRPYWKTCLGSRTPFQ